MLLQSVRENQFDEYSAMYHLLLERYRRHRVKEQQQPAASIMPKTLPLATQRKSSITTGIGEFRVLCACVCRGGGGVFITLFVTSQHHIACTPNNRPRLL